jgi:hypothetical protein
MVGLYEVTAVLPEFQNRQRYRVRYYGSFIEQVIEETDLSPAKAMPNTPPEAPTSAGHVYMPCGSDDTCRGSLPSSRCCPPLWSPCDPKPLLRSAAVLDPTPPSVISLVQFGYTSREPAKTWFNKPA